MLGGSRQEEGIEDTIRDARLATVDGAGCPLVTPITDMEPGDSLYCPTDAKPKRVPVQRLKPLRNIQENPQVALVIDDYGEHWTELAYVILHGTSQILTSGSPFERAIAALREKYSQYRQMPIQENP